MTRRRAAGSPTVPSPGPLLPAEATTMTPASAEVGRAACRARGQVPVDGVGSAEVAGVGTCALPVSTGGDRAAAARPRRRDVARRAVPSRLAGLCAADGDDATARRRVANRAFAGAAVARRGDDDDARKR